MKEKILERLWLSKDESRIYMCLINNPKQSITDLSNNLSLNRPLLYKLLPNMEEMWLIWELLIWKRKYYIAENPEVLKSYFNKVKDDFDLLLPQIKEDFWNNFSKPIFKHLRWKSGIKNIFMDIANTLNTWDVFYRYSSRNNIKKTSIAKSEYLKYSKIRDEKKLERMVITNDYLNKIKENKLEKEVVIIPVEYDMFEDNITKIIYANKVAIIDNNSEECFIIESNIFSNFERKLFKLLFKFLRWT